MRCRRLAAGSSVQAVAFRNRVDDLIDFDFAAFRYANIARAAQDGVELTGAAQIGSGGWLGASLTWLDARDGDGRSAAAPPACRRLGNAVRAAVRHGLRGDQRGVGRTPRRPRPRELRAGQPAGFVTVDAAAALPLAAWVKLRLRAENLAGRAYEEVRGYPAPGRRFFLGAEVTVH